MQIEVTEEEKTLIEKRREEKNSLKIKKIGFLKHDLYGFKDDYCSYEVDMLSYLDEYDKYCTKEIKQKMLNELDDALKIVITKGNKFCCLIRDNVEHWFEESSFVGGTSFYSLTKKWAENNLENIQDIKE